MMLVMLTSPERTTAAAASALRTWSMSVVPSLFPYMVLCRMLSRQLAGRRLSPALAAAGMGLLGGSPSGAAVLGSYAQQGRLRRDVLLPLCALTGTISPMFMLGMAGGWLGGGRTAVCLLAAHLLAAALSAGLVRLFTAGRGQHAAQEDQVCAPASGAAEPVTDSVRAILSVGGCIVFYSVVAEGMTVLLPLPGAAAALLHGILEAAGGAHAICCAGFSPVTGAVLVSAVCGFGGVSILSQNLLFVRAYGVHMRQLVLTGLLRAALAAALMALFLPLCPL